MEYETDLARIRIDRNGIRLSIGEQVWLDLGLNTKRKVKYIDSGSASGLCRVEVARGVVLEVAQGRLSIGGY